MKKSPACIAFFYCLILPLVSFAQSEQPGLASVQQKFSTAFAAQFKNYPHEKAFVQASQNVYLTGQTIWYKAYSMAYGKPSQLSKVVYVRLSNANGKLIRQDKLPLKNSAAYGNIDLPDSLQSGWYTLQVFTAWMLNFDKSAIYGQAIYIQNARQPVDPSRLTVAPSQQYHIDFFPEGGKLIDGLISNIAFKAVDGNGEPVKVYGDIMDEQKKPVAKINTEHDGMGSFTLETYANAGYVAQVHFPGNTVQNIPLPKVEQAGLSFRVNPLPAGEIDLLISFAGQQQADQPILVEAVQADGVAIAYPLQLSRGINVFALKKGNFNSGILHLGAFDNSGRLVAERSVFIEPGDSPAVALKADTLSFRPGTQNTFTLSLTEAAGMPVQGTFSVAVTDADMGPAAPGNIGSSFLLGSEVGAYLHNPGYYFQNNSDSLRQQLDLVMLTSSARNYNWDNVLAGKTPALKYAVERSQFIAGKIEKYQARQNLKLKVMIASADSGKVMAYVAPDSTGTFKLDNFNAPGDAEVFYEAINSKNRRQNVDVTFFNENIDTVRTLPGFMANTAIPDAGINPAFVDSVALGEERSAMANGIMLKPVDIKQHKPGQMEKLLSSHVKQFDSDNAQTLDVIDGGSLPNQNVFDYINGRFAGLTVTHQSGGGVSWSYHGANELPWSPASITASAVAAKVPVPSVGGPGSDNAYLYIDEVRVDETSVDNLPMTDVALVRFVPPPVWFAPLNGGFIGAIMIYTKNADDERNAYKVPGINTDVLDQYTFNGYSVPREFSPGMDAGKGQKPGPGFRTTLFWSHDLQTDDHGNAQLRFYANGKTKRYRIVVQGFDKDGQPVYLDKVF
jgi:hypothetical protein